MLTELSIRNVAIIDHLQLSFGPGLNLLTGETGAGKSIIIDALTLVCGGRASADLIRTGEEEATVEALFDLSGLPVLQAQLQEAGLEAGDELLIKRTINRSGRNRVYLNGSLATLGQLADIGRQLVTIHGQHESQGLLRPDYHLVLLDAFAGASELRQRVVAAFEQWKQITERLAHFDEQERDTARRIDLLAYQVEEIAAAELKSGEEEELEERQRLLANAERLACITGSAYEALYGGDQALLGDLKRVTAAMREAATVDAALAPLHSLLDEGYLQLEDAALQLRDYAARIEADPEQLKQVDDRLDLLTRLKRKYAPTVEEVMALGAALATELEELQGRCRSRDELQQGLADQRTSLERLGAELSEKRRAASVELEQQLAAETRQLAMPHAVVQVAFEPLAEPRSSGFEKVELLFSPNPGEPPRPLAKVASGGELSRLMLAFKQVLPEGEAPTMVFDEVDTGVGGAVAGVVGRKLRNLASGQQVFCVTHLPQVAAWAMQHIRVEKRIDNGRTSTLVTLLDEPGRVQEVARMLAGEQVSDAALQHATEMIEQSSRV
ncbi:DNA repair protein RecN [Trichlorobacter lovleyi]|uniref:DNA repair protein RecN n=1 Tax=Trichlorobacter lovleyi TaxID=313985 RepID=UPI002240AE7D|nr:DNA repair protein RecN [Trichlorobacter lovleyi]QOX79635.1 DNA repair protein RecN [Trichlorobacter lovleyi]